MFFRGFEKSKNFSQHNKVITSCNQTQKGICATVKTKAIMSTGYTKNLPDHPLDAAKIIEYFI